ncbi:phospholipid carrier-dependent glycosyltransferase [Micromonospora sp. NBC_01813]|uniref:phospholipid carrier-dependent glycosyltransferase n=1 Tax=Micromonospora sp. NBC_01813 TaxID=2975988 RepID=UPI002DD984B0|nr:phospholipid carrier-dependent glycosyltransferase [Micromonospora sp. NBC_01813]WSA09778.1 phospholipid carrier-dependent glycosyltransferase [Micromonospora sp. NBC_01813]
MSLLRWPSRALPQDAPVAAGGGPTAAARESGWLGWLRRNQRWWYPLVVVVLLAQMAFAMVTTAVAQAPTIDEPVYVGAAALYWQGGGLQVNPEHPPLGKLIIGAGLAFAEPRIDPQFQGNQTDLGRHVLYEAGNDADLLLLLARLPMILLTLGFGLVVLAFARDITGRAGALVALTLYAFTPDVIAHGSLAALDVATAGFLLTSTWLLWRARRRPWVYLPLAGLALGAALATKMSALAAVPVLLPLAAWSVWHARPAWPARPSSPRTRRFAVAGGAATAIGLLALLTVWVSYLVVDPRLQTVPPGSVPAIDGLRATVVDWLPFPESFRDGMRIQFGFEDWKWGGYLFGETYSGHRWYYLPAALLVKTPLGALVLWLAGAVAMLAVPRLRPAAAYLLLPAGVLLAVAMTGSRDLGVRYALFVPVFLAVAAAALTAVRWPTGRARPARIAAVTLVALVAISSVRAFPFYLPYANEAFGGPAGTYHHLHDSNVDWGQDLERLADRLRQRYPNEQVWLAYKGAGVPEYYGIVAADPREVPPAQVRGLLVVSNTWVATAGGELRELIDSSEPIGQVGHSMTIFRR